MDFRFNNEYTLEYYRELYTRTGERHVLMAYTDGSGHAKADPRSGGWAFILMDPHNPGVANADDIIATEYGGEVGTTNNRMELKAILGVIHWAPEHSDIVIRTDSQYCIGMLAKHWNAKDNVDLISDFFETKKRKDIRTHFDWVKGHSDDLFNNYVDKLTNAGNAEVLMVYSNAG